MFNIRVRRVLVVMDVASGPRPMRPTQRPRLWAMTLRVIQTALAQKRSGRQVVHPDARTSNRGSRPRPRRGGVIGLEVDRLAFTVGYEGVVVVGRETTPAGCQASGLTLRTMRRTSGAFQKGPVGRLGHIGAVVDPVRDRCPSSSLMAAITLCNALDVLTVTE